MLSPSQLQARDGKVTASFLPKLMSGDTAAIMNEWRRCIGDPDWEAEDLDGKWPVAFGSFIEPFALDWHEGKTGQTLTRRGEVVVHPERPHFCCTLDAYRPSDNTVIDCKAPGMWRKIDDVLAQYIPQMVGQRACVGAQNASLLVVHGGSEPVEYPVTWDDVYEAEVWTRVDAFWLCVQTLTPPCEVPAIPTPVKAAKIYDFGTHNQWCAEAVTWLTTRDAAKDFSAAEKTLKGLIPADASGVTGAGIHATRNKAGSISIRKVS